VICPLCNHELKVLKLLNELVSNVCLSCKSKWIKQKDYYIWKDNLNLVEFKNIEENLDSSEFNSIEESVFDAEHVWKNSNENIIYYEINGKEKYDLNKAKICPECEHILIKYKVSKNLNFYIECCGTCGGVWLDTNKWDIIYENDLYLKIYDIFTHFWQKKIRDEHKSEYFDKMYKNKFGRLDYEKLKDFKNWIEKKDNKKECIDFLIKG
jgi:Zn-finger nucleic acid-binding protein